MSAWDSFFNEPRRNNRSHLEDVDTPGARDGGLISINVDAFPRDRLADPFAPKSALPSNSPLPVPSTKRLETTTLVPLEQKNSPAALRQDGKPFPTRSNDSNNAYSSYRPVSSSGSRSLAATASVFSSASMATLTVATAGDLAAPPPSANMPPMDEPIVVVEHAGDYTPADGLHSSAAVRLPAAFAVAENGSTCTEEADAVQATVGRASALWEQVDASAYMREIEAQVQAQLGDLDTGGPAVAHAAEGSKSLRFPHHSGAAGGRSLAVTGGGRYDKQHAHGSSSRAKESHEEDVADSSGAYYPRARRAAAGWANNKNDINESLRDKMPVHVPARGTSTVAGSPASSSSTYVDSPVSPPVDERVESDTLAATEEEVTGQAFAVDTPASK